MRAFRLWNALTLFAAACGVTAVMLLLATGDYRLAVFIGCQLLAAVGGGIGSCVSWSLMADAMDYEEWKFGTRNEGTTYAMHSFFRKLAQGVGPSLGLVAATMLGYNAELGAAQPMDVAIKMRYLTAAAYLFSALLQFVGYALIYNLDKKTLAQMEKDLTARRAAKKA